MTSTPDVVHNNGHIHRSVAGMTRLRHLLVACLLASLTGQLAADKAEVTIDDFAFLSGFWLGEGFGGVSEEVWMPPADGRMFGIFKQSNNSVLQFTEFLEIVEEDSGWVLRLKHFNPDFSGWEEKDEYVTFPLRSVGDNEAVFGGLSYQLIDKDRLKIELRMRENDGSVHTEVFKLARQKL